jgi:hypothetical protein
MNVEFQPVTTTYEKLPAGYFGRVEAKLVQEQPRPVVREVHHDGVCVGFVVDTRRYQYDDPDTHGGPWLVPLDHAWAAEDEGKARRWSS